ncbi:hypothetical protein HMI55_002678, partial [Coelomomyces lativittatus]
QYTGESVPSLITDGYKNILMLITEGLFFKRLKGNLIKFFFIEAEKEFVKIFSAVTLNANKRRKDFRLHFGLYGLLTAYGNEQISIMRKESILWFAEFFRTLYETCESFEEIQDVVYNQFYRILETFLNLRMKEDIPNS